jgi:CHAD domain-containing protein
LRSALKLFETAAPCPPALLEDIRWLGNALGAARDWDVLLISTLAQIDASPGGKNGLMDLQALALAAARDKRRAAAQALLSPRYTRLLLTLGLWMQQITGPHAPSALRAAAGGYTQKTLQRLHKSLLKRANRMDDSDPASIHRTRIAAKRGRYALEFFHSLYRVKGSRDYLHLLSDTQEELGQHNDLVTADRLLQELAQQGNGEHEGIHFARGYLLALQAQRSVDLVALRRKLHALRLPHRGAGAG